MQRTDLLDTDLEIHKVQIRLLLAKSAAWRLQKALELTDLNRAMFPVQTKRSVRPSVERQ